MNKEYFKIGFIIQHWLVTWSYHYISSNSASGVCKGSISNVSKFIYGIEFPRTDTRQASRVGVISS